jgi:hypothetical protein
MRPVPLEMARCLHVPGAGPPPPPVRRWPDHIVAADSPWPSGQACRSCDSRRLVPASCCRWRRLGHLHVHHLSMSSRPAWAPPRGLPRLRPRVEEDSPFFWSPWQASHCSRVRYSFPPIVIGLEGACGSSPSTTLRRPIVSSIDIVERSSTETRSSERSACTSRGCNRRASQQLSPHRRCVAELHHLLQQSVEAESKVINILTWLEGQVLPLLTKCL